MPKPKTFSDEVVCTRLSPKWETKFEEKRKQNNITRSELARDLIETQLEIDD
jgi:hypothetical protein